MHTFPAVKWLEDWKRTLGTSPHAQREYVKSELDRIAKAGAPVLSMVLMAPLEIQTHLALSLLHNREACNGYRFWFRLVPSAKPPGRDPQGRELAEDERGKVLVAKVGTKGGQLRDTASLPEMVVSEFTGPAVQQAAWEERDIYQYVRIGRDPIDVPLSDAVIMMRRYGYQIAQPRYKGKAKRRDDKGQIVIDRDVYGDPVAEIDFWMVEEIPPQFINNDGTVRERMTSSQPNKGK